MFLSRADGDVRELPELPQGCQGPSQDSRGKVGFLSRRHSGKDLRSRGGENLLIFLKLSGAPLQLRRGPQAPARGATGRYSLHASREGPSVFLCSHCQGQGPHLELRLEPQGSSPGRTWISWSLLGLHRGVRSRLVWRYACPHSSRALTVVSGFL